MEVFIMKNIILICPQFSLNDIKKKLVTDIIKAGYRIVLLIISPLDNKTEYENLLGVEKVMTPIEVEEVESVNLIDYDTIQKCRLGQFQFEIYASRGQKDHGTIKYSYYTALNFWLNIFNNNNIDCVISTHIIHGRFDDVVVRDVAKIKGIKSFFLEDIGYGHSHSINYNGELLPVYHKSGNTLDTLLKPEQDKRFYQLIPIHQNNKNLFFQCLYNMGGNLLEDFSRRIIHWNWKAQSIRKQKCKAFWSDKFIGYIKIKQLEYHLNQLTVPLDKNDNYVFYALHFEPEANIEVRVTLENQLTIIKMLSESLPLGWKLYIKEHPSQFKVNNDGGYEYMISVSRFKSKDFYDIIHSFPNTKIVTTDILSNELITHCKAVASIVGTVSFEAIRASKPLLLFSDLNPAAFAKDVFNIHSYEECKKALIKISEGYSPKYDDVDNIINQYTIDKNDLASNIVALLNSEI